MARIGAPAQLKLLHGRGPDRDSGGRRVPEPPAFDPTPPPKPGYLSPDASEYWDQLIPQLERMGILRHIHGPALEMVCECWARYVQAQRHIQQEGLFLEAPHQPWVVKRLLARKANGEDVGEVPMRMVVNPHDKIARKAAAEYRQWAARFGLSPADRARLGFDTPARPERDPDDW